MGIESDHLVYEYLSQVGDLAQRRHLSSGDRMRLVAGLRDEIDRRRAKYEPETPAAVRRILERIGTPEEVLDTLPAAADVSPPSAPSAPSVPVQRGVAAPHLAGVDEAGAGETLEPDWWTVGPGSSVEGFAGGIEIPELLKGPGAGAGAQSQSQSQPQAPAEAAPEGPPTLMGYLRERRRRAKAEAAAAAAAPVAAAVAAAAVKRKPYAFLMLAGVALIAGAVSGYWLLLAAGWLLAYASRVLGPAERKWVVFGLPGVVFAGAVVWLWGRLNGRWGAPLADEALSGTFQNLLPWLARAAAVSSAAYLFWRSRRR
ncbi:hypothetical protein OHA37_21145 [Streptomyces sp. NBC_00335]|uniref:hypothetical protein n=1 Tax=unclassified Streptomyces TaxID=2593676 RepID=UPI002259D576|nr:MULTISPECIES: hypothetical protein [unclassified Streptomyces]MCX5406369.1 hypothetical protein [Streptomyces sp. NBC_00086]